MKWNIILLGVLLIAYSCKEATEQSNKPVASVEKVIDIPSYNYDELKAKLLDLKNDTTYVVNFWATWCKPCVEELPAFEKMQTDYGTSTPLKVVLVSLDFPNKMESQVLPFIKENNIQSDVILFDDPDANRWIPLIDENWSGAIPATLIFNAKNQNFYERSFTFKELKTELQPFINLE